MSSSVHQIPKGVRASLLALCPILAVGCGASASDSVGGNSNMHSGGSGNASSDSGGITADAGGSDASGGAGGVDSGLGDAGGADAGEPDAGCYRDPYLPDNYEPPCEQPKVEPNCTNGWCTIEPGCFIMGQSWCQWQRAKFATDPTQVTLTHRFRVQQFEVTQKQWTDQALPNPSTLFPDGTGDCLGDDCPVGNVAWTETLAFANLLSQNDGAQPCYVLEGCEGELGSGMLCDTARSNYASIYDCPGYRLPTGAEWEYAARAGTNTTVYTGDIVDTGQGRYTCYDELHLLPIAWYCANAGLYTHPVGQKMPNDWGLYDMIGNASEWSGSITSYRGYGPGPYVDWDAELVADGLRDTSSGHCIRQIRGSSWNSWPNLLQVASQLDGSTTMQPGPGVSFRLVQSLGNMSVGTP